MKARQLLICSALLIASAAQSQALTVQQGQELFDGSCARCHGFDATGAIGPNLQRSALLKAEAETAFKVIVQNGIPARGMPSTPLSDAELSAIGAYIRSMRVVEPNIQVAAAARGREVYRQQDCGSCHIVQGVGKGFGPELTDVGIRRKAEQLRHDLTEPSAAMPQAGGVVNYLPVKITTNKGQSVSGQRLNEDAFTIQLRDSDGRVQSFKKQELQAIEKQFDRSSMPRVTVEGAQLDDLVVYLTSLRGVK
jgi:putative heme-binding domain-containing protein